MLTANDDNQMTPLSYLKIFFRRKEYLLIPMFIGLIIGVCTGIVLPKEFESTSIILVEEGKSDNPLFDKLAVSTTVRQRMSAIRESMLGWNSLVKLVKRLEMDKGIKTPKEFENLILDIRRNIKIKLKGQNIINLSYYGEDPEMTQAVVKNVTDIFIERNQEIQSQDTADAISFIEEQLKVYRGKIKSADIAKMREKLKNLLFDSTDEHPTVKQLKEQIANKEAELKAENLEYSHDILMENKSMNPIIAEIHSALENIEGEKLVNLTDSGPSKDDYYKIMLIEKLDKVMARDSKVNQRIYSMLLSRLETAKITQRLQASKEGTKYTVLDPPRIPLDPIKPNRILVASGGLAIGAVLGFCLVVLFEFLDKSFIDVEEAKQFLGKPLLGAISKITTEASLHREREKAAWLYSMTFVAGVVAVILTTAVANFIG